MADIEKIRKVVAHIEKMVAINPRKFDMGEWGHEDSECGTTACFAGWAPTAFGEKTDGLFVVSAEKVSTSFANEAARYPHVEEWTKRELELTFDEAERIFYACSISTVDQLKSHINVVLEEEVFAV